MQVMGGLEKHTRDKNERLINKLSVLLAVSSSLSFGNAQMRVLCRFHNSTKYIAWITWFHAQRNRWHYSYFLTNLKQASQKLESSVHFLVKWINNWACEDMVAKEKTKTFTESCIATGFGSKSSLATIRRLGTPKPLSSPCLATSSRSSFDLFHDFSSELEIEVQHNAIIVMQNLNTSIWLWQRTKKKLFDHSVLISISRFGFWWV